MTLAKGNNRVEGTDVLQIMSLGAAPGRGAVVGGHRRGGPAGDGRRWRSCSSTSSTRTSVTAIACKKLQGIAVSPGVAIGEALVMDTEGFRIPRRFVSRDAVDDELERLDKAIRAAGSGDRRPSRDRGRRVGREVRRHLRGPLADAPGRPAPQASWRR